MEIAPVGQFLAAIFITAGESILPGRTSALPFLLSLKVFGAKAVHVPHPRHFFGSTVIFIVAV